MVLIEKKSFSFNILFISAGLLATGFAQAAEKYPSTVEDGTAKVISATTAVDQDKPAEEFIVTQEVRKKAPPAAPQRITHRVNLDAEISSLKQENAVMQKRLAALEAAQPTTVYEPTVEASTATPMATKPEPAKVAAGDGFDAVPDERVREIAERLKYTNEILKRFGRAYDYRSTTLSEFKKILAKLEASEEKTNSSN
jgi:hypothetical protein